MKITKQQLKQIIKEELEEGLGDMIDKLKRRHKIQRAGQPEEFMNQYYLNVRDDDGKLIKRHEYRDHTDESAWEQAEKLNVLMLRKLSRYLFKKGISDLELLKIIGIVLMAATFMGMMLYGAIGALFL